MDDFAVDLDKVLDDFELSEGGSSTSGKAERKFDNLPGLQPPISGGPLYTSQVAPLETAYTSNHANNPTFRPPPSYASATQYDIAYQPIPHLPDYASHNPVIQATIPSDGTHNDVISPSKQPVPMTNNSMQHTMNMAGRLAQSSLTQIEPLHKNEKSNNEQWSSMANNNMTPYAVKYGMDGGVLAHGERSNINHMRRLSDDQPELLQSMAEKTSPVPPYSGEVSSNQVYSSAPVISLARPDVVPVSLINGVGGRPTRPTAMDIKTDSMYVDNNFTKDNLNFSNDASSMKNINVVNEQQQQQHQLPQQLQQPQKQTAVVQHQISPIVSTPVTSLTPSLPHTEAANIIPEDMNIDTSPNSLQPELNSISVLENTSESTKEAKTATETAETYINQHPAVSAASVLDTNIPVTSEMNTSTNAQTTLPEPSSESITLDGAQPVSASQPVDFNNVQTESIAPQAVAPHPVSFSGLQTESISPKVISPRPVGFSDQQTNSYVPQAVTPRLVGFSNLQSESNAPKTVAPRSDGFGDLQIKSVVPQAVVGFSEIQVNITEDDIDAYLADLEEPGVQKMVTGTPGPLIDGQSMKNDDRPASSLPGLEDPQQNYSRSESQSSGGSVEQFLAPSLTSPRISTPRDDPGFSKVPGYVPAFGMSSLEEEEPTLKDDETDIEVAQKDSSSGNMTTEYQQEQPARVEPDFSVQKMTVVLGGQTKAPSHPVTHRPQVGDDCVMLVEKGKSASSNTSALGAITVSFPVQADVQQQPMDTSVNSSETEPASILSPPQLLGMGARPKEKMATTGNPINTTQRKSRPNSLLGLSKPDLNITMMVPSSTQENGDSGYGGEMSGTPACMSDSSLDHSESLGSIVENQHDIINRQLAQKARSPLQKKQLNLEIKQHLDNAAAQQREQDARTLDNRSSEELQNSISEGAVSVVTNRAQLASGVGLNLPTADNTSTNPMIKADSAIQEDIMSSSSSSSLISVQAPSPAHVISGTHPGNEHQQQESAHPQEMCVGAQGDATSIEPPKLKRPTSLSLMPRGEFSANQDKSSTEDDSITGDGSSASSGGQPIPFQGDNEMSEPAEAMASGPDLDMMYSPPEVGPGAFSPAPRCSSNINVVIMQLGKVAPRWVPDAEACNCMQCEARFTFTKRRHHCRACGKVFCSACCNLKCKLQYMDNKEARVCSKCYQDIIRAQAYERMHSPNRSPNPNNPAEYCSTIPPHQQAAANAPPPTVMVPVGVLRKEGSQRSREPKQVMFSDGIRPGGDLSELDGSDARIPLRRSRSSKKVERLAAAAAIANVEDSSAKSPSPKTRMKRLSEPSLRHACLIPDTGLPPVIMSTGVKGDFTLEEDPNYETIMPKIRSTEDPNPVVFAINKNLFVLVKIVNLDCCLNRVCWCFSTKGMCTVGQDEIVIVLECLPDEKTIPRDIFCHINSVYDEAGKGNTVSHLGHTIFGQSFLESRDHSGFLYVRPTFQCLQKLLLPQPPYVFGLLLQKWETPWAKVFPVRLMLRLGAEYRYYPCPLISVRLRKPVYGEIGHTIMNLLADFRNYQYMLPQTRGVVVHMEEKKTFIKFPRNRYEEVMKVITNSNDHVMALGANFSTDADSHLVCIQNEDGNYQTQAINIQNKPRKVTGASFVVFNGALKSSSGLRAKSSIVEDGLMVQITSECMAKLKAALLDMKDYTINCGSLDIPLPEEQVIVQWVEDDRKVNQGVKSPVDGLPMDGIESIHIHNGTDYVGETRTIRWTEVFFIQNEDSSSPRGEPVDLSRLAESLAQACCIALTPHLDKLKEAGLTKVGLRCNMDRDNVGYEVGSNGKKLPDIYMNDLDNELIPVIHNAGSTNQDGPVVLELIFYIIE